MNEILTNKREEFPQIAIIILNWNGWHDTLACLETVYELQYPAYFTIVVDNSSTDDSVARIRQWTNDRPINDFVLKEYRQEELQRRISDEDMFLDTVKSDNKMVLIRAAENLGFAGGNNLAIHYVLSRSTPSDYVLLLNNDIKIEKDCIDHLVSVAHTTDAGIIGTLMKDYDSDNIQTGSNIEKRFTYIAEIFSPITNLFLVKPDYSKEYYACSWLGGNGMMISVKLLNHIFLRTQRYLDSAFFMYCEDNEICYYARKLKYKCVISRDAVIHHKLAGSSGGIFNPVSYYYINRNSFFLANRYLPVILKPLFQGFFLSSVLLRSVKNIIHGRYRSVLAICEATFDAYRNITGKWKRHDLEASRFKTKCNLYEVNGDNKV